VANQATNTTSSTGAASGSYRGLAATANHSRERRIWIAGARGFHGSAPNFSLKNLGDREMRAVLETGRKRWLAAAENRRGEGIRMAAGYEKGSYVATFAKFLWTERKMQ